MLLSIVIKSRPDVDPVYEPGHWITSLTSRSIVWITGSNKKILKF